MSRIPLVLLLLAPAACGGSEEPAGATTYADAPAAVTAAQKAESEGDYAQAADAYRYAVDFAPTPEHKVQFSMNLFRAQVRNNDVASAQETMTAIAQEHPELLTGADLQTLADFSIGTAKDAKAAGFVLSLARNELSEAEKANFDMAKVEQGIDALASGDSAALEALGYAGD